MASKRACNNEVSGTVDNEELVTIAVRVTTIISGDLTEQTPVRVFDIPKRLVGDETTIVVKASGDASGKIQDLLDDFKSCFDDHPNKELLHVLTTPSKTVMYTDAFERLVDRHAVFGHLTKKQSVEERLEASRNKLNAMTPDELHEFASNQDADILSDYFVPLIATLSDKKPVCTVVFILNYCCS